MSAARRFAEISTAVPPKPQTVTGTVSSTNITVNVSHQGKSSSFSARVELPSGAGPFPAVVVLGGFGADTASIKAAGAAVINYDPYAVGKEGTPRNNKQGASYSIYGATSPTGLLMAWSWGVSRIIDVLEQSGGNILRGEQPWLGDAFGSFTSSPNRLPVDTHEIVAMVAPRGLFIMDNPHIANLGPRSAGVAALGGAEVYRALGAGSNITEFGFQGTGTLGNPTPTCTAG